MFIQKRQSENQNLSDTLAFQICSFSASSCYKIISADPFHLWSISFHPFIFHFIHSFILHITSFIHTSLHSIFHSFHSILHPPHFNSRFLKFDVFLQLNNTYHELQPTSHISLHFISCDPFHSIIHFIHTPSYHISLFISYNLSSFQLQTIFQVFYRYILQSVGHSTASQTFCSQRA